MTKLKLIHNNNAGDEDHSKEKLIKLIESQGFNCDYSSIKAYGWHKISADTDLILIAGGDGTVRQVISEMLKRTVLCKKIPIALLPLGTANNLSKTLGIESDQQTIESLKQQKIKKFDVAQLSGIKEENFFMEGIGFGIFPELIRQMKKIDSELSDKPQERIDHAIKLLQEILTDFQPCHCQITIDGVDHSGDYLLAEVMNIQSIGPNLKLAPYADAGDGLFEIVLIPENDKQLLTDYLTGLTDHFSGKVFQGQNICIKWGGNMIHVDDQLIKLKPNTAIKAEMRHQVIDFMVV